MHSSEQYLFRVLGKSFPHTSQVRSICFCATHSSNGGEGTTKPFFEIEFCRIVGIHNSVAFHRTVTLPRWRLTNRLPAHGANRWRLSNMPFFPPPRPFGSILFRIFGVIVLAPLSAIRGFPRPFCTIRAIPLTCRCIDKFATAHLTAAYALSQRK